MVTLDAAEDFDLDNDGVPNNDSSVFHTLMTADYVRNSVLIRYCHSTRRAITLQDFRTKM